jgi:hypothetical protein
MFFPQISRMGAVVSNAEIQRRGAATKTERGCPQPQPIERVAGI